MFEFRFQTYWADSDPAGIVYFANFFRFAEQAEDELFRAAGHDRLKLIQENQVWMPRVEAFSKFSKPIKHGDAIRVRLNPHLKGSKTVRYEFEIVDDVSGEKLAEGYITVVCVDALGFKATPIPEPIRAVLTAKPQRHKDV